MLLRISLLFTAGLIGLPSVAQAEEPLLPREEGTLLVRQLDHGGILVAEDTARRFRCSVSLGDTYAASLWAMKMASGDLTRGYNQAQRSTFGLSVWLAMGLLDERNASCEGIDPMPPGTKRPEKDAQKE